MLPGQRRVGSGSLRPAALCSVYPAAPRPSAAELKLRAAAETPALPLKPGPLLDEPGGVGERREVRGEDVLVALYQNKSHRDGGTT